MREAHPARARLSAFLTALRPFHQTAGSRAGRPWLRPFAIMAGLWVAWLTVAFIAGPRLLESAYAGSSFGFLNDMIRGRDVHSLEYYMAIGRARALSGFVVLVCLTVAVALGYRFRTRLIRLFAPMFASISTTRPLHPLQLVMISGWFGIVLGLAEASKPAIQRLLRDWPTSEYYQEALWMVPLANAATLIAISLLLVPIAVVLWPRRQGLRLIPAAACVIAVFTFIRYLGGVQPAAALILATGVTIAAMRLGKSRPARAARIMRWSGAVLVGALTTYAAGLVIVERVAENRAVRSLAAAPAGSWNVLLLILDTVRAADVSVNGYDRPTTPNLERLARRGVVFENAWSTAPWTLPAHASMFTGQPATRLSTDYLTPLDDRYPTIAEELGDNGWLTAGFVSNYFYAGRSSGLARGFIRYEGHPESLVSIAMSARLPLRLRRRWNGLRHDQGRLVYKTAEDVNREFLDWLPASSDRPFFAFLNYLDAHDPYTPPEPWQNRWAEPGARYAYGFNEKYSPADLEELRARYDGAIAYIDAQIGQLVDELDARGQLDNTLIIVTSDHGEEFGEHDPALVRHGWSLYSQALHVPLMLIMPGRVPEGLRVDDAVSTERVAATIADLVLPGDRANVAGTSLRALWDEADEHEPMTGIVSVATKNRREMPPASVPISSGELHSIVEADLHYILREDGVEELYDTRSDPGEQVDLSAHPAFGGQLSRLRSLLRSSIGTD